MATRILRILVGCLTATVVVGVQDVTAQARFEVLSRSTVSQVTGLSIYTIHDEQLANCYLLFIMEPSTTTALTVLGPPPDVPPPIVEGSGLDQRAARANEWAAAPWATLTPGEPTGGWEHLAESMRLALVDPTTARALAEPVTNKLTELTQRLDRIELLLRNTGSQQRIAALPVACDSKERK